MSYSNQDGMERFNISVWRVSVEILALSVSFR